jgi:DnaJ-domain-containing protein 1
MASPTTSSACWNCGASAGNGQFCPACGKIQPMDAEADYFSAFGLPEKLELDPGELERRFLERSWKLHPDNFVCSSERERNLSLELSARLNDAYRTLADRVSRIEYLLARQGVRKEGETKQQAPAELLEEVFEMNESLEELRLARQGGGNGDETAALRERLGAASLSFEQKLGEVDAELDAVSRAWDGAVDDNADAPTRRRLMTRMNEILNRRSYINNLVANVGRELAESE